jgi:hypothetical protein
MRKGIILSSVFLLSMAEPVKVNTHLLVKVVDKEGITHQLKGISCNGRTYLKIKEGSVDYAVPFEDIRHIRVLSQKEDGLEVDMELKGGLKKHARLDLGTYCTSISELGKANFYIRDVRDIFIEKGDGK